MYLVLALHNCAALEREGGVCATGHNHRSSMGTAHVAELDTAPISAGS